MAIVEIGQETAIRSAFRNVERGSAGSETELGMLKSGCGSSLGVETRLRRRWSIGGRQARWKRLDLTLPAAGKSTIRRIIHASTEAFSDERPIMSA